MIEIFETDEFTKWLRKLKDVQAKMRINIRIGRIASTGLLGDVKFIDEGVSELKIDYGPGYRIYFAYRGDRVLLLLIGGDKSTQARDIDKAKRLNREYE